jgi:hypothetical protein
MTSPVRGKRRDGSPDEARRLGLREVTSSPNDHTSIAATGCCIGQAWIDADGFGLPNSSRAAAVTALTARSARRS